MYIKCILSTCIHGSTISAALFSLVNMTCITQILNFEERTYKISPVAKKKTYFYYKSQTMKIKKKLNKKIMCTTWPYRTKGVSFR